MDPEATENASEQDNDRGGESVSWEDLASEVHREGRKKVVAQKDELEKQIKWVNERIAETEK